MNSPLNNQIGGDHYKKLGRYQPWEVLAHWMNPDELRGYMKGTVIAYLAREADKGGDLDIEKATHTIALWQEVRKDVPRQEELPFGANPGEKQAPDFDYESVLRNGTRDALYGKPDWLGACRINLADYNFPKISDDVRPKVEAPVAVPQDIIDAAEKVRLFMAKYNVKYWRIGGVQSRVD